MAISESVSCRKVKRRKKLSTEDKVFYVFIYTFFALFAIVIAFPLIHILALSLNERYDAVLGGIYLLPREWSLDNYRIILEEHPGFISGAVCTVARTLIGTFTGLVADTFLAYILSRRKFLFKSGLSLFWIIAMFIHGSIIPIVPVFVLYRYLHLTRSFWVYIIPGMVNVVYVMAMRTYMQNIPDSLEEASQLEGAGYIRVFWIIISPLCKPIYASVALFIAAYHWNSWVDTLCYNRLDQEYTTMPFELVKFFLELRYQGQNMFRGRAYTPAAVVAAATVLAMLPILVISPFFQKYYVSGLKIGGVKE